MRLVTFEYQQGSPRAGVVLDNEMVMDLGIAYSAWMRKGPVQFDDTQSLLEGLRGLSSNMLEIIRGGDDMITDCFELARRATDDALSLALRPMAAVRLLAPLPSAPLLLHFENNPEFALALDRHLGGRGEDLPETWDDGPSYYYSNPSFLLGNGDTVAPPHDEDHLDFELELAVVLGENVRDCSLEDAEDAILGYTMVNDWSARSLERNLTSPHFGCAKAKSIGTAVGPALVTKEEFGNPYSRRCRVRVNGEIWGEGNLAALRWSFAEMISYASEGNTLPAGSILCSGALPGCSGLELKRFPRPGDSVDLEIDGLGTMNNRISERPRTFRFKSARSHLESD